MNLKLKFGFHFEASEHNKNRLQYKTVKTTMIGILRQENKTELFMWFHYKLNTTDDARCKDERDQASQLIDALRLRNKR